MPSFNHILVVCVGNICRSPTAEFLLRRELPDKHVESAGLGAMVGEDMESMAREVAESHGLTCGRHVARQLTREMCRQADIILVMEGRHREAVAQLYPEARGKTFLLAQGRQPTEVVDPYRRPRAVFETVYEQMAAACSSWVARLSR